MTRYERLVKAATEQFNLMAKAITDRVGTVQVFAGTIAALLCWAALMALTGGPDWLLNGGNLAISIVSLFLLMFLQNSQNRDSLAVHLKLDEILRALADADTAVAMADSLTADEIIEKRAKIANLCDDYDAPVSGDESSQTAPGCGV